MKPPSERLWALVLAGGDGTRLQPLTRLIAGAPIPKQYCRIIGSRSLLVYRFLSVQAFSNLLGTVEIAVAVMIAMRPLSARVAAVGSAMAVIMFLTTLSFLFSTPGWEPSLGGFPALSVVPGQFLLKDVVLLGAVWSLGEALNAIRP